MTRFPKIFCWSKIGTEAGLTLDQIIRWKEMQRSLSDGIFFWGIGSVPSWNKQVAFLKALNRPRVLFSEQLGKARPENEKPTATMLWTHYIDAAGDERALPRYAAVTSKASSATHHAIIAHSREPLSLKDDIGFDIGLFGNLQGRPNLAFQQPAPIVEANPSGSPKRLYRRGFWADLERPCFVTLHRGRKLSKSEENRIKSLMSLGTIKTTKFKNLIDALKGR